MTHIAINLEYGKENRDLALPPDVPVNQLIDGLIEALRIRKQPFSLAIKKEFGFSPLPMNSTFEELGIYHGSILFLMPDNREEITNIPVSTARFIAESGQVFYISNKAVVGRNDSKQGIFVEIDLSRMVSDPKIISRRHAQVEEKNGQFYITDLGSTNGTRINNKLMSKNSPQILRNNDNLEFGRNGVKMVFTIK